MKRIAQILADHGIHVLAVCRDRRTLLKKYACDDMQGFFISASPAIRMDSRSYRRRKAPARTCV